MAPRNSSAALTGTVGWLCRMVAGLPSRTLFMLCANDHDLLFWIAPPALQPLNVYAPRVCQNRQLRQG